MSTLRWSLPFVAALVAGCACKCPDAKHAVAACAKESVPAGRWTGDWESYPLDNPSFVREGTFDLVIAEGGKLQGATVEDGNLDRGALTGTAKPGGAFEAAYTVTRDGQAREYTMQGNFVCEGDGLSGMGQVSFDRGKRGSLKFQLKPAP
jgi:hypothetical protein